MQTKQAYLHTTKDWKIDREIDMQTVVWDDVGGVGMGKREGAMNVRQSIQ